MSTPTHRRTMLAAAVLAATTWPRAAEAQSPPQQPLLDKIYLPNPLHLPQDFLIERHDEWRLRHDRARLRADLDRGDTVAVNRDLNRVQRDVRGIWYDRRRIQGDSFQPREPWVPPPAPVPMGATLIPHPQYPGYGYHPADPAQLYRLPQPVPPPGPAVATADPAPVIVEIRNPGPPGTAVEYEVDGVTYRTEGGGVQKLTVGPSSIIRYDRGPGLGAQQYALSAGVYEFEPGAAGRALFKRPVTP
jgi:hypothetical protein